MTTQAVERRVRRLADRQGYVLRKSRIVNINLDDHGEYMLLDASLNIPVRGARFDADLDEIAAFLAD